MPPARATVVDPSVLERLRTAQLRDALDDAAPDLLVATSPGARNRLRASPAVPDDLPTLVVGAGGTGATGAGGSRDGPEVHELGAVDLVVATTDDEVGAIPQLLGDGALDPATETYVVTDRLSLSVRPADLATDLEGLAEYRELLWGSGDASDPPDAPVTHLSTGLPADYYAERDGLRLRGAAPTGTGALDVAVGADDGEPAVLTLALGVDGVVAATERAPDDLGLRAVRGVGRTRAGSLRSAGIETRADLVDAEPASLAELDGFDRTTAARIREHARAHRDGAVLRRGDDALPRAEPVFVDVETDGLAPSVAWLIGVLDRDGSEETYMSFLARDPDAPGEALAAFCSWYVANAADRPLVAYNGHSFDFPVLEEQIERHCPQYLEEWRRAWRFDPYAWAVRDGNATLPGRTNGLEDVAAALGYESSVDVDEGSGVDVGEGSSAGAGADLSADAPSDVQSASARAPLSGAEVARIYRRWARERSAEPDWDRLEAYCEDDVRQLAAVYDALREADRIEERAASGESPAANTTQGNLGDF